MLNLGPLTQPISLAIVGCLFVLQPLVCAADETPLEALKADNKIATAIEKLNSNTFADRNEASRELEEAGKPAIEPLADAALGDSREVTLRSLEILKKHFQSDDEQLKAAAKQALERIAASGHESAAHRAKEILEPKPPQPLNAMPGLQVMPGQLRIQINAVGGRQARQVQMANGVKTIRIEENGEKIKIVEDPAKGIEIEITRKKDGKETTEKYAAKSADELKKQHPEAYKLYDKYAKQQGGGIQVQAIQVAPGVPFRVPAAPQAVPAQGARRAGAAALLKHASRIVESSARQLEQLKQGETDKQQLDASIKRLKGIQQQLEEEAAKLGGR